VILRKIVWSAHPSIPSAKDQGVNRPTNAVVVLLDSLNRHLLGAYGSTEFDTPNLDRFARERATRFTRHVTGSLPCMPARHDILCGALDFLWKPWGSIELWEQPITRALAERGVTTMLVTDHPHLFETGGENYHTDFGGWEYLRGHEGDPWRTHGDPTWIGAPTMPARTGGWWVEKAFGLPDHGRPYDRTRTFFRDESDYPCPRTMVEAARFLREATPHHDRWFMFVDEFDPHEPFDTPERWATRYQPEPWDEPYIIWPPYAHGAITRGTLTEREGRHIRANYGAKLAMTDHWFGQILDRFDEQNLWADTMLIVCTDHGHYLGEMREDRDIWGKPGIPQFEPLGHTPLLVHYPGTPGGGTCDALTTNVDLFATIADVFDATVDHVTHGRSMVPLLTGTATSIRDWAIGGVYGNWVQVTDGRRKYARGPSGDNFPLSMWSNRWSTMPMHVPGITNLPKPDDRAVLDRMPGSTVPVIRQPFAPGDLLPMWANAGAAVDRHFLYDLTLDPDEQENRTGERTEADMLDLLRHALESVNAPTDQFTRLGL
jgi:arylsulfatase A-like enzyme